MQFQSLVSLWFGLSLPIILLMYLLKRKYIDTMVPSTLLWNRVLRDIEANRPWQKLRNNLLLLLQLLFAALLVFALLQPYVWKTQTVNGHVVIVLDISASMDALTETDTADHAITRLDAAKKQINDFIEKNGSSNPITLITMGTQPEVLVERESNASAVLAALQAVKPFYGKTSYKETMSLAAALTQEDKDAAIQLYTDGQWTDNAVGLTFHVPVEVIHVGSGQPENIGIIQFGVKHSETEAARSGGTPDPEKPSISGVAALKNWGLAKQEFDVTLYTDGTMAEIRHETLQPGEQKTIHFAQIKPASVYKLMVEGNDSLAIDNTSYAFLTGVQPKRALLVSPGNLFLEKALQLSGMEVVKVQSGGNEPLVLPGSDVDIVVIDTVSDTALIAKPWQELLAQKPVWYIHSAVSGQEVNTPNEAYRISDHPLTQYIKLQDVHISKIIKTAQVPWGKPIISIGESPLVFAGIEKGKPRLLFTFDLHQSDLPLRSEFPILVQNAVSWLSAGKQQSLGRAIAGEKMDISLVAGTVTANWLPLETIDKVTRPAQQAERQGEAIASSQSVPSLPGLYQFVEKDASGAKETKRYVEVTVDLKESNGSALPALEFTSQNSGITAAVPDAASKSPYELLTWIELLLLLILFVEWGVYQRGTSI